MAKLNPNFPGHFRSPLIYFVATFYFVYFCESLCIDGENFASFGTNPMLTPENGVSYSFICSILSSILDLILNIDLILN